MNNKQGERRHNWLTVRNAASEVAPAFGVLRVTGSVTLDGLEVLTVDKPNGDPGLHLINGPADIPAKVADKHSHGRASRGDAKLASYDSSSGTPSFGDECGPVDDSWKLSGDGAGFVVVGAPDVAQERVRVFAVDASYGILRGNPQAVVLPSAGTFPLVNLVPFQHFSVLPEEPLTVVNLHTETLYPTDIVYALYRPDTGNWETLPTVTGFAVLRGNPQSPVAPSNPTFILTNLITLTEHARLPVGPVTAVNLHAETLAVTDIVYVLYRPGNDTWETLPQPGTGGGGGPTYTAGCGIGILNDEIFVFEEDLVDPCDQTSLAVYTPTSQEVCAIKVLVGCGIKRETDSSCGGACSDGGPGSLTVDPEAVAGKGLIEDEDNGPCDCAIQLDLGCGLEFGTELNANKVQVKVDPDGCLECDESSMGLKVQVDPNGCLECDGETGLGLKLNDTNSCLLCEAEGLRVDVSAMAGDGLVHNGCNLNVDPGNCLEVVNDQVNVKVAPGGCLTCGPTGLAAVITAGSGLVAVGCTLAVVAGNCIDLTGGAVNVKVDPAGCLTCAPTGLKLTEKLIKDVTCALTFENETLKLTLTKIFCDDTQETSTCTVPTFTCEE